MPLPSGYVWTDAATKEAADQVYRPLKREEIEADKNQPDPTQQWDWQNEQQLGPQGQALPDLAIGWKPTGEADFGIGLQGWWNKTKSNVASAYQRGQEEGLKISGITSYAITKTQGEEKGAKTLEAMKEDRKPDTKEAANAAGLMEAGKEAFGSALWGALDVLSMPAVWTEQALGSTAYAIADVVDEARKGQEVTVNDIDWKRNWNASRLLYSGLFDATVFSEMERRIDSGMRGDLAAQEVMMGKRWTMWSELGGQLIFDPLNAVSVLGKAGKQVKTEADAAANFLEIARPEVAKLADDALDATRTLDNTQVAAKLTELVSSQQGLVATATHADNVARAGADMEAFVNSFKLGDLTSDGKMAHVANESGEILLHVANNSANNAEAADVLAGMLKSVDADPKIAAEGMAAILHFANPKALLSKAGDDTIVMLKLMTEKFPNWLDDIAKLKDNPTELTKMLLTRLDETGQEMFPGVQAILDAEKEYNAAIKAGKKVAGKVEIASNQIPLPGQAAAKGKIVKTEGEISARTAALAEKAKLIPDYVKQATQMNTNAQKIVNPINKVFVGAYMGWSPGFAFRNFTQNSIQIFMDHGIGALLGSADTNFAKVEALNGGAIPVKLFGGTAAEAILPSVEKAGETAGQTGIKAAIEAGKKKGAMGPLLGASQTAEANAGKKILAHSYRKTFDRGVSAMVKALTPDLQAAGIPDSIISRLPTYIYQNNGDSAKIINAIRADVSSGVIDLFNDVNRIDPKYKAWLSAEGVGKWDEYVEKVLQAPTREEALTNAKKIFDDIGAASNQIYTEAIPGVGQDSAVLKYFEKYGQTPTRNELISFRQTENQKAIKQGYDVLADLDNFADEISAKTGVPVRKGDLWKKYGLYDKTVGNWGEDAATISRRWNETTLKITKELAPSGADPADIWRTFPEIFSGPPPEGLTQEVLVDKAWTSYFKKTSELWTQARQETLKKATGYLDEIERISKQTKIPMSKDYRAALEAAEEGAAQWDDAVIGTKGMKFPPTPNQPPNNKVADRIVALANQYGIPTATEKGVKSDKHILAIINKHGGTNFKSLDDPIDIKLVEDAFAKRGKPLAQATATPIEAAKLPREDLPAPVSDEFLRVAKELQSELFEGQAGHRQFGDILEGGAVTTQVTGVSSTNANWYRELYARGLRKPTVDKALEKIVQDAGKDTGVNVERLKEIIIERITYGDPKNGIPPNIKVLAEMGADEKTLATAVLDYNDITHQEKTLDELLGKMTGGLENTPSPDVPYFDEAGNWVEPERMPLEPPSVEGELPQGGRMIKEQMVADGDLPDVTKMRTWIMDDIATNYGKKQVVDRVAENALQLTEKELKTKLAETRLISSRVAQASRDFTLLNYGEKSYWDAALAYLYPFHFWYKGTYKNWLKRIASNPAILGHYSRYKEILGTVHADMPEWWRYNINTNDLPGVDVDNPYFFNLEAALWPLNGITGTDFNDTSKRVNWWTYTLDFANKFGPSTWTPISMVTGLALYSQGEKEAGEKWMGRLFPQTASIKAAGSLLGIANLETDPLVKLFQDDLDPYERGRVQRAMATMAQDAKDGKSQWTPEQVQDAAYKQEGPIWDQAVKQAIHGRAGSQIASFLLGVGYKGRTNQDMEVDKFYGDYSKLFTMRPNLTTQEWRDGMDALKTKYPFMDTVLLAKRDSEERDAGFAYTVMSRIPPAQTTQIAKAVGVDSALLDKFYADKGAINQWPPADRQRFMAGILDIASVLEIPTDMTRKEWTAAKNAYTGMTDEAKSQFGENILDAVDGYYAAKNKSYDAADAYLEKHPEVEQYMNWKSERIMNSPLLSSYYGGASMIENYYRAKMYKDIETKLGADITDVIDQYNDIKTYGTASESKAFYRANKARINKYYDLKDSWMLTINQNVAKLSANLPEGQGVEIRPDIQGVGAQNLQGQLQEQAQPTFADYQAMIPEHVLNLVVDYYQSGKPLTSAAQKQLDRIAYDMNISGDELLQQIGVSMYATP
jgi:hypothetical protein